jgi:hypothetical protein
LTESIWSVSSREERVPHPAADQQPVREPQQVPDHAELVRHLGPAEHDDVRPGRVLCQPLQHGHLGRDEVARRVRQQRGQVVDRRLLAVHHAKPVAHVHVA